MCNRYAMAIVAAMLAVVATAAFAMFTWAVPPTAVYVSEQFGTADSAPFDPQPWESVGGSWKAAAGTYDNTLPAATAVSTIFEYKNLDPVGESTDAVPSTCTYGSRMLNRGVAATQLIGVVYNYHDVANYYEAVFSPTGTMLVRRVLAGTMTTVVTTNYLGGAQNVWFEVQIIRDRGTTTIKVNGITVLSNLLQTELGTGRVGLITHNTTAKFDGVSVGSPFGPQPFRDNFSSGLKPNGFDWATSSTAWTMAGGTFNNNATEATSRASVPNMGLFYEPESTLRYTLWARMFNPYGGAGNLVGLYFNDRPAGEFDGSLASHGEVVFTPTGVARIDLFYDGARHTVATAPYNGQPNTWFDVRMDNQGPGLFVWVDGVLIFENIDTDPVIDGGAGLLTHWSPAKFDDVWWDNHSLTVPLWARFEDPLPDGFGISGTWDTSGGTLNATSAGVSDIATLQCCWNTDMAYRGRLLNQYGASGNLVGLVYNYQQPVGTQDAPDYFEVVFAPTGQAYLNKVINGVRSRVATGTHDVPRDVWFDVEIVRRSVNTTVKVNGRTIFDKVPQGDLGHGAVGVVTHWSKARFDDLSIESPLR
jgi:hypothetical protein